jgi:hypothetical protein
MSVKPNLFIVGHTRSGTTSLKSYLNQHPDVFIINNKKGFFGFTTEYNSEEEYLKLFSNCKNKTIIGEKCTDYLLCSDTAKRLKSFSPDSKIIILLRNPIEQIPSLHRYLLNETLENIEDLETALEHETLRKNELSSKYPPHIFYREQVKYSEMVECYFNEFDKDKILIIIFDDLKNNSREVYQKTCKFLSIDESFMPKFEIQNVARSYRSKKLQIIFKKIPNPIKGIFRIIPYSSRLYEQINYPEKKHSEFDPLLRKKLQNEFLPEIKKLSMLLDRDLTFWCKN